MTRALSLLTCVVLACACASASRAADWPTYGFDLKRGADNTSEHSLGPKEVPTLQLSWAKKLGGGITAQPVVAGAVPIRGRTRDVVYIGTEHGAFVALDADSGKIIWRHQLGVYRDTGCPQDTPDGKLGVTGTAAIDRRAGVVYAVGADNKAYAFALGTGAVKQGWPVSLGLDPLREHVWSGLTLANGRLYVLTASDGCDTTPYYGRIVGINTRTHATSVWYPASEPGGPLQGAGLWSAAGLSVDPATGDVFVATGNDVGKDESAEYGEHVVRLRPSLTVVSSNYPGVSGFDVDFGSTPVLFTAPGCPQQAVVENKMGVVMLYKTSSIAAGPVQKIKVSSYVPGGELVGNAAYSPATNTVYVTSPTDLANGRYQHGLIAFRVGKGCKLSFRWGRVASKSGAVVSSPTVADGVVYYGDGPGDTLRAVDASNGTRLWESTTTITGPIFGAPTVVNGRIFVGSWDGTLYSFARQEAPSNKTGGTNGSSRHSWLALVGLAAAAGAARMLWRIRATRRRII